MNKRKISPTVEAAVPGCDICLSAGETPGATAGNSNRAYATFYQRPRRARSTLLALALSAFVGSSAFAQSAAEFSKANREYTDGRFKEAIAGYEAIARKGEWTPNLFYNLGNAYFRDRDFGRAILNYERTLALDPRHAEAEANLRITRDEARALELQPSRTERFLRFATANQITLAAAIAFWIGAFSIAILIFTRRRSTGLIAFSILPWGVFLLLTVTAYRMETGSKGRALAVVTDQNIEARLATADSAGSVLALPAGSEVKMLSRRGDWVYATLPNNLRGWVPAKSVELVRL